MSSCSGQGQVAFHLYVEVECKTKKKTLSEIGSAIGVPYAALPGMETPLPILGGLVLDRSGGSTSR